LGRSVSVTLPARCTIMATGNNLSVKGDMTRRAVAILLDAKVERPELRKFNEKDLPGRVLRDRGVLLQYLFTILKGYQQAGSPDRDQTLLGRFEDWTGRVCGPIRWLGYPDPLDSQERLRQLDPEADRVGCLMEAWWDFLGTGWYTAGDIIKAVDDPPDGNKQKTEREAMKTALRDVAPEGRDSYSSRLLGWYLMHHEGRIVEEFRLERKPRKDSKTRKAQQYRVINTRLLYGK
jgi:putative DNA primase/helicase